MSSSTPLEASFAKAWQDIEFLEVFYCYIFRETIRAVVSHYDSPSDAKQVFLYSKPNHSHDFLSFAPREIK